MRIVLATIGTLGDLHPFMALSAALRARGAQVVLACAEEYRDKVSAAGIAFAPLSPSFAAVEARLGLDRARITRRMLEDRDFLFRVINPHLRAAYDDMLPLLDCADLLLAGSLAFGAHVAAERCGVRCIGVALQPLMLLSAHDPPVIPGAACVTAALRGLDVTWRGRALSALKWLSLPLLRPVRHLRAQAGLPPSKAHPLFEGQYDRGGAIALYSGVIGEIRPDHPPHTLLAGFAWYDSEDGHARELPADLRGFLAAGDAPVVFTLGSAVVHSPGDFYRHSAAAARSMGRRAVLLVGEAQPDIGAELAGRDVFVARYAPHSLLFAAASAVVHHGGIGTLAQALRAGKPQLVVPHFADQFDNAERARVRCGARVLLPRRYTQESAARILGELLADAPLAARVRAIGERVAAEDGAARAARAILPD